MFCFFSPVLLLWFLMLHTSWIMSFLCIVDGLLGYNHFRWREWSRRNRAINGHNVASDPSQIRFQCMHLLKCSSCFIFWPAQYFRYDKCAIFTLILYAHLSSLYLLLQLIHSLGSCSQTFCSINNCCGVCMVFSPLYRRQSEAEFKTLAKVSTVYFFCLHFDFILL